MQIALCPKLISSAATSKTECQEHFEFEYSFSREFSRPFQQEIFGTSGRLSVTWSCHRLAIQVSSDSDRVQRSSLEILESSFRYH